MIQREHIRQRCAREFVSDAIDGPHLFASFDSARKSSAQAWNREKSRGVVGGFPDSGLFIPGQVPLWWEWKDRGNKPDERQQAVGDVLMGDIGHLWSWGWSIVTYCEWLALNGVQLRGNAALLAQRADAKADSLIAKAEAKAGKAPKSYRQRATKPTAARLRKGEAVRSRVMF